MNDNIETRWQEYFQARGRWDFKEAKHIDLELRDVIPNRVDYLRDMLGGAKRHHASFLTKKLAERAINHSDPEVQKAGEDFIELLSENLLREELVVSFTGRTIAEIYGT